MDAAVASSEALLTSVARFGGIEVPGSRRVVVQPMGSLIVRFAFLHPLAVDWRDIEVKYPTMKIQSVHVRVEGVHVEAVPSDVQARDFLVVQFF